MMRQSASNEQPRGIIQMTLNDFSIACSDASEQAESTKNENTPSNLPIESDGIENEIYKLEKKKSESTKSIPITLLITNRTFWIRICTVLLSTGLFILSVLYSIAQITSLSIVNYWYANTAQISLFVCMLNNVQTSVYLNYVQNFYVKQPLL